MDVHHTKRMTWSLDTVTNDVRFTCPVNAVQLIPRHLNRGALRDAEITDTRHSFDEMYKAATKHNRPAEKKGIQHQNKHAQPKDYVPAHTVKQAIMLMRPYMNKDAYDTLLTNAAQARTRPTAYTLLSHAQYKKWKAPCLHQPDSSFSKPPRNPSST